MTLQVRPATPSDRAALFRICLLTASAGTNASGDYSDPDYPGLVWSVPYLDFARPHAFVLAEDGAEAIGYVVGAPDTLAFEARLATDWWPALRSRYGSREARAPSDPKVLDRIRTPERTDREIAVRFPAHLHINILPQAQGGGWGRRLIETELASLRAAGVPAVHLGVSLTNERAMEFYRHLGFAEVRRDEGVIFGMAL